MKLARSACHKNYVQQGEKLGSCWKRPGPRLKIEGKGCWHAKSMLPQTRHALENLRDCSSA